MCDFSKSLSLFLGLCFQICAFLKNKLNSYLKVSPTLPFSCLLKNKNRKMKDMCEDFLTAKMWKEGP